MNRAPMPRQAALLGYAGVLPFAALSLVYALGMTAWADDALRAFLLYGGIILSFLGGLRWGAAAGLDAPPPGVYLLAVLPSLWAWAFLLWANPLVSSWGLLAGFVLMALLDGLSPGPRTPAWMVRLRLRLSAAVIVCHLPVIAVLYLR